MKDVIIDIIVDKETKRKPLMESRKRVCDGKKVPDEHGY